MPWKFNEEDHVSQRSPQQARQQIALSGIGGQGVLFVTKLLAETAVHLGWSVLLSETHGMAQRGGNVISHLKVWDPRGAAATAATVATAPTAGTPPIGFTSPLIRAGQADVLLALHPEALTAHGFYLNPKGTAIVNAPTASSRTTVDADRIAAEIGQPIAANLVLLGFAAAAGALFCTAEPLREVLDALGGPRRDVNRQAFQAGLSRAGR